MGKYNGVKATGVDYRSVETVGKLKDLVVPYKGFVPTAHLWQYIPMRFAMIIFLEEEAIYHHYKTTGGLNMADYMCFRDPVGRVVMGGGANFEFSYTEKLVRVLVRLALVNHNVNLFGEITARNRRMWETTWLKVYGDENLSVENRFEQTTSFYLNGLTRRPIAKILLGNDLEINEDTSPSYYVMWMPYCPDNEATKLFDRVTGGNVTVDDAAGLVDGSSTVGCVKGLDLSGLVTGGITYSFLKYLSVVNTLMADCATPVIVHWGDDTTVDRLSIRSYTPGDNYTFSTHIYSNVPWHGVGFRGEGVCVHPTSVDVVDSLYPAVVDTVRLFVDNAVNGSSVVNGDNADTGCNVDCVDMSTPVNKQKYYGGGAVNPVLFASGCGVDYLNPVDDSFTGVLGEYDPMWETTTSPNGVVGRNHNHYNREPEDRFGNKYDCRTGQTTTIKTVEDVKTLVECDITHAFLGEHANNFPHYGTKTLHGHINVKLKTFVSMLNERDSTVMFPPFSSGARRYPQMQKHHTAKKTSVDGYSVIPSHTMSITKKELYSSVVDVYQKLFAYGVKNYGFNIETETRNLLLSDNLSVVRGDVDRINRALNDAVTSVILCDFIDNSSPQGRFGKHIKNPATVERVTRVMRDGVVCATPTTQKIIGFMTDYRMKTHPFTYRTTWAPHPVYNMRKTTLMALIRYYDRAPYATAQKNDLQETRDWVILMDNPTVWQQVSALYPTNIIRRNIGEPKTRIDVLLRISQRYTYKKSYPRNKQQVLTQLTLLNGGRLDGVGYRVHAMCSLEAGSHININKTRLDSTTKLEYIVNNAYHLGEFLPGSKNTAMQQLVEACGGNTGFIVDFVGLWLQYVAENATKAHLSKKQFEDFISLAQQQWLGGKLDDVGALGTLVSLMTTTQGKCGKRITSRAQAMRSDLCALPD